MSVHFEDPRIQAQNAFRELINLNPPDLVLHGDIYNNPPRCRCGECGMMIELTPAENCHVDLKNW